MNDQDDVDDDLPDDNNGTLAELTEAISRRLESGEPLTGGDLGDDPETAGSLRRLLPALRTMVSLGEQVVREAGSRTRLRKKNQGQPSKFTNSNASAEEPRP
jgi:hypothetical protein